MSKNSNDLIKQINRQLNRKLNRAMDKVGETVRVELADYIFENWYKVYDPSEYSRTFDFLNSVTKTNARFLNGVCTVKVYFDEDKINFNYDSQSRWNQHMSLSQEDVSNAIAGWIEYGNNPRNSSKVAYEYEGIHMIDAMVNWLKHEYVVLLKKELKIKTI